MINPLVKHKAKLAADDIRSFVESHFRRKGMEYDETSKRITEATAKDAEREIILSETAKIRERKKRAAKHRLTKDLFE